MSQNISSSIVGSAPIMINVSRNSGQVRISSVSQQMGADHLIGLMGTFYTPVSITELNFFLKPCGGQKAESVSSLDVLRVTVMRKKVFITLLVFSITHTKLLLCYATLTMGKVLCMQTGFSSGMSLSWSDNGDL